MNGTLSRSLTEILYFLQDSKMHLPGVATLNVFLGLEEIGRLIREGGRPPMLPTDPTQQSTWSKVGGVKLGGYMKTIVHPESP